MWRSLESLAAARQLLRPSAPRPLPVPAAMLSALARPVGTALRRSFSTSAQVGPARAGLRDPTSWPHVQSPKPPPTPAGLAAATPPWASLAGGCSALGREGRREKAWERAKDGYTTPVPPRSPEA